MPDTTATLRFGRVACDGVTLHVAEAGPPDGPLVILLHGFPEFWYGWRHQIEALAAAGWHVVAPDQRGYNLSDKPRGVAAYDLDRLATDILRLADHFGAARITLVGHDWGASVGWWIASRHPERLARFAALSAPHPAIWRRAMRDNPAQRKKSRYVALFRLPWLPEFLIRQGDFAALAKGFGEAARPDAFTPEDLGHYRAAWSQPGAITATVNWYRTLLRKQMTAIPAASIAVPTLLIWGEREAYAVPELADESISLCRNGRLVRLKDATHWLQHDQPETVNTLLLDFLGEGR